MEFEGWKVKISTAQPRENAKSALRQGIKKSQLQCWKDLMGEVEMDPWGLAFKKVTERLVTRSKTPGLDNPDRV